MNWKNVFKKGQELTLSTCSKNSEPNANIVISLGFVGDKLLIADAQMDRTIKNLKENGKICIVSKADGKYYRLKGEVKIFDSGKYFDICIESDKEYPAKNAIVVSVKEVFDLDNINPII